MLVALAAAGLGLANLEARVLAPPGLDRGEPVRLEGVIEDVLPLEGTTRLEVAVARAPDFEPSTARFRVRLYTFGTLPALYPGQRVLFPAQLKRDAPADNPGQWDLSAFRLRHALPFTGSLDARRLVVLSPPASWRVWLSDVQRGLSSRVRALAPSPEAGSLYLTLAAGLRADLGAELENRFALSGLAHVLSVSGLHVAVLALLTLKLLRFLAVHLWTGSRRHDARRLAAPIAVPFVWAYVIFTGNQPPAVRSAVMATIFLAGMGLWERSDALNSLAIACAALLLLDPSGIADLSLQLSFIAVLSLILLTPAIRGCLRIPEANPQLEDGWKLRVHRWVDQGVETLCASAAVTAAGAPLIASTFHRVSFAGLFSNVICLPLCGLLTILAASGAGAFVLCPPLATPLLWAGGWASALLLKLVDLFAALPGAAIAVPSLTTAEALVFYLCLGTFALAEGRWRWIGLGAPAIFLLPIAGSLLPFSPGLSVTFLAVGHGDAIVLSSGGRHALVDGGGVPSGADTGRKFVIPFLREKQIYRLDLAVLSHPHPDHALGLASTLREVPARRLWVSASAPPGDLTRKVIEAAGGATIEAVEQGHPSLRLGEAEIDVLGPPADPILLKGLNDRSVVLRVRHQQVSFLLTGDIEADGEQLLTPGTTTVLKAPHHGSRTSSTSAFLEKAGPRFVVFCVGRGNRFGFPNEAVVRRYRAIGSECFRTDFDGAVAFESDGRDVRWKTFHPHTPNAQPRPIAHSEGG
jgi:competence protein ComEC